MNCELTKVVVLAGGKGTRLHPFSLVIPKPLMPVGEDPILLHLMNRFKSAGIRNFLISTGYQAELIRAYFGDGSRHGVEVQYYHEERPLGTAGPLALMKEQFSEDEYLFLINGDIYTELDFKKMKAFAISSGCDVVVGYVEKVERSSFGVLEIESSAIQNIVEKPERRFNISAGIYVIKGSALKHIPVGEFFTMPNLIGRYLEANQKVGAFKIDAFWVGIENTENLEEARKRLEGSL